MSRNLTAAVITEITAASLKPRLLAYFDFLSGAVRAWTGVGDLSWNSQTWTGVGTFGSIQPPEGGTDISAQGATFQLSGIPSSLISDGLAADYQNRACEFYLAFLDAADAVIATPYKWQGRMDTLDIIEGGEDSKITIRAESRLIDLERPKVRRYSDEDQQEQYPGDVGLEFSSVIPNLKVSWGDPNAGRTVPRPPQKPKTSA